LITARLLFWSTVDAAAAILVAVECIAAEKVMHPSLHMGGGAHAPAFLASAHVIVVLARTPDSSGLDVLSDDCIAALAPWNVQRRDLHVVASTSERVYPFGSLAYTTALSDR
jgi:hypothetical protein